MFLTWFTRVFSSGVLFQGVLSRGGASVVDVLVVIKPNLSKGKDMKRLVPHK